MSRVNTHPPDQFEPHWQDTLVDYVTAIAYSPDGKVLAASSGAGEVALLQSRSLKRWDLQPATGASVDCLAFSSDSQYLATGGQDGHVKIWQITPAGSELIATLGKGTTWIEHLAWSPSQNLLAVSLGKTVQIWDGNLRDMVATLHFETSSVLALAWQPDGKRLSVGGYQGIKIWTATDWNKSPELLALPAASLAIAWSPDGQYIASGNLDRTVAVWEPENPDPWVMQGFPGKIRHLAWPDLFAKTNPPLLAIASADGLVIWEKQAEEMLGWEGRVLVGHQQTIQALQFQPHSLLLASAGTDGRVYLWKKAKRQIQVLQGTVQGFSCLSWHPHGNQLAAGGQNGELLVWSKTSRGQGFGSY
jgi:WD40 repeat protein